MTKMLPKVEIYTDGASRENPGPGGYAAILKFGDKIKEISRGFRLTTNNRMELMAIIEALKQLKVPCNVTVYTDSQYVANSIEKGWVFNWVKKNFKGKSNADLWKEFLELYKIHKISIVWIKGHNGHIYNERCDKLAVEAAKKNPSSIDFGYEKNLN